MSEKLTNSQEAAIKAKGSILVSAAAGSGKTRVLTERVIRKLTDDNCKISADKLLIVTFTNAAALEMRTRIENALLKKIAEKPGDSNLVKQYNLLPSADISTIDSFCINIVRENFEECGVEQNFTVSDGSELTDSCNSVLSELIDGCFEEKSEAFTKLLQLADCENDDAPLRSIIKRIYNQSNSVPFPGQYINGLSAPYFDEFKQGHIWFDNAIKIAEETVAEAESLIDEMRSFSTSFGSNSEKAYAETDFFDNLFSELKGLIFERDWDKISLYLAEYDHTAVRLSGDSAEVLTYKYNRQQLKNMFLDLKKYFSCSSKEISDYLSEYKEAVALLIDLVSDYSKRVFDVFAENNTLAFYHTEQIALKLLCDVDSEGIIRPSNIAKEYISRYDEVMVDEYQDVNDLQELMFSLLSDDSKKLFVVGDVKQSIYRFRGSNPRNFIKKKNEYSAYDENREEGSQKIILAENFRSRKCVCEFVNYVFEKILTTETGGITYGSEEVLNAAAKFPESEDEFTDLLVVNSPSDSEDNYAIEARVIAEYIVNLINSKKPINRSNGTSPINYGDICVLFESLNKAPLLVKTFNKYGIPVSFNGENYCKSPEISLVLALLSVIDNPLNNVDLLTVLLSPLSLFTPDDIALLRKDNSDTKLYRALLTAANTGDEKCRDFINKLDALRKKSVVMSVSRFVSYLVYETAVFSIVSSLDNSKFRRKNIYSLINAANSYSGGIGGFVQHIRSLPDSAFLGTDSDADSVKIMTIHKSKGLQFPVCILSNLKKKFNTDDTVGSFILSENIGISFKPFDEVSRRYVDNVGCELAKNEIMSENLSERIRLLYVAMTRAQEKLVLVTSINRNLSLKSIAACLTNGNIPLREIKNAKSLGALLMLTTLMHPDAEILRTMAECNLPILPTSSRIRVIPFDFEGESPVADSIYTPKPAPDNNFVELIKRNISFEYPNEYLSKISAKASVSQLTHSGDDDEYLFSDRPGFMNDSGASPTMRGTAVHKIMQFINFTADIDIESEISRLVEWKFITEKEGEIADRGILKRFFLSDIYKRILRSPHIEREMRFLTEIPAGQIYDVPAEFSETPVIVQGAVDLLFFEDDGIVIVDFKTDRASDPQRFVELYSEQLKLYAAACTKKFNKPVKELVIYSFNLSKEIKL